MPIFKVKIIIDYQSCTFFFILEILSCQSIYLMCYFESGNYRYDKSDFRHDIKYLFQKTFFPKYII